jgi:ribonuclease HIII
MKAGTPPADQVGRPPAGGKPIGWVGIDESGKGDYFGPLVIAAVHVTPRIAEDLLALNVRDSKKISDSVIHTLAGDIKTLCRHSIIAIGPERYNQLYENIRNLNKLLAWGHAKALETILEQVPCVRAIADQFGDCRGRLNRRPRRVRASLATIGGRIQRPAAERRVCGGGSGGAISTSQVRARRPGEGRQAPFQDHAEGIGTEIGTSLRRLPQSQRKRRD